jgi:hypothetical protein
MKARLGPIERIEKESPVVNSMRALMLPATTFRPPNDVYIDGTSWVRMTKSDIGPSLFLVNVLAYIVR